MDNTMVRDSSSTSDSDTTDSDTTLEFRFRRNSF